MNVLNEKARILRTQITAEKKRNEPNKEIIVLLENELNNVLEELRWE